ncbi:hypothetical protein D6460_00330 [Salmonella enterica subsp. enterica serovar Napoli]|uniref:Uncharacterized protein n=1 Tax=Salmonella enterica subsp. enterica serovar Napoli TaxID=1151001 RepID=A0A5U6KB88_SALET|nr:hypothetical protein [Salmonella enterica subsp. enterica serovar Napoli]EAC0524678.1 hypothetical protein [Salmonella enterica subsp. enterica serovar Zaiman]EAA4527948.1 hypothetical protein [Salmonella enterica subsp. enterica serovar Napoli]EAB8384711.1 hypothetical protein [Salmonella enterica subsp. enterica serovar Napoli]EAC0585032.1 hypothetical protein [Salmonella enterica subsp. enterica serovar Napoli]
MIIITKYRNHPYHPLANTENLFYDSKNQDGLNTNPGYQVTLNMIRQILTLITEVKNETDPPEYRRTGWQMGRSPYR